jgi:uncharacterized protein (DUF305 family)
MDKKSLLVGGIIGLVLGHVISVMAFGGFGGYGGMHGDMRGSNQMMSSIDKHFIEQMIPHHEGAIEMAQLALEKAKRPETKTLAHGIIAAQQKEITDMKAWYKQWYGTDVPILGQHMMNGHMMGGSMTHMDSMSGDMEALKRAIDFDLEFVKQMIPHHEMAVMMAQMLQGSTNRSEMKILAQNIITSQNQEIEMMRGWVTAWSK